MQAAGWQTGPINVHMFLYIQHTWVRMLNTKYLSSTDTKSLKMQAAGWQTGPINCPAMPCLSASCTPTQYLMQQSILTSLTGTSLPSKDPAQ